MEVVQLALIAVISVSVISGAIIAAWRLIPHTGGSSPSQERLESLEEALEALRLVQLDFADKWEISIRRNNTRVGRLRRKLAKERGEDEDDDEAVDDPPLNQLPVAVPPCAPQPLTKGQLFQQFYAQRVGQ